MISSYTLPQFFFCTLTIVLQYVLYVVCTFSLGVNALEMILMSNRWIVCRGSYRFAKTLVFTELFLSCCSAFLKLHFISCLAGTIRT